MVKEKHGPDNSSKEKNKKDSGKHEERPVFTGEILMGETAKLLGGMSEKAKAVAGSIYEGMHKIPIANRIIGKMEIAFNQLWINKSEKKAAKMKGKMDSIDISIDSLDQAKSDMENTIEELRKQGMPGIESLQLEMKKIDQTKRELLNKKDKFQTKFEASDNKAKVRTNKRDGIADKLIGYYENKLGPMENELSKLQFERERMDLMSSATEIKNQEILKNLKNLEDRKTQLEKALSMTGASENKIKRNDAVKGLAKRIKMQQDRIEESRLYISKRKNGIDQKIAKVDKKSNPYRDKRGEFLRIKENRPLEMNVKARSREEGFQTENVRTHTRGDRLGTESSAAEDMEKAELVDLTLDWNDYLKNNYEKQLAPGEASGAIDHRNFMRLVEMNPFDKLSLKDFKKILTDYYKLNKINNSKLDEAIENFSNSK